MIFKNNKVYDVLSYVAGVVLPALETLWLTLGNIWGFSYTVKIGATIAAVDVFLGALLKISSHQYKKMQKEEAEAKEVMNGDA